MKYKLIASATLLLTSVIQSPALAQEESPLLDIQHRWAEVNYQLHDEQQIEGFEQLAQRASDWVKAEPNNANAYIWLGIVKSTQAGAEGGLGALGLAKDARAAFEKALDIDPQALQGSAYASLGVLYFKVPGWPFGFGDDDKAKELLNKALEINPDGIDSNYFFADFLYDDGDYRKAKAYAEKALQAKERPQRPLADAERRKEVQALLTKIERKLS